MDTNRHTKTSKYTHRHNKNKQEAGNEKRMEKKQKSTEKHSTVFNAIAILHCKTNPQPQNEFEKFCFRSRAIINIKRDKTILLSFRKFEPFLCSTVEDSKSL